MKIKLWNTHTPGQPHTHTAGQPHTHTVLYCLLLLGILLASSPASAAISLHFSEEVGGLLDAAEPGNLDRMPIPGVPVRLAAAELPLLGDKVLPGSWGLMRLRLRTAEPLDVVVSLSSTGESWSASAHLSPGVLNNVDIGFPFCFSGSLRYSVTAGGRRMQEGRFSENWLPAANCGRWAGNYLYIVHAGYIVIGNWERASSSFRGFHSATSGPLSIPGFKPISPAEMERLGQRQEYLDQIAVIYLPSHQSLSHWRSLPGIADWIRSGGLLVAQDGVNSRPVEGRPARWSYYGWGAVVETSGLPSRGEIDRMLLSTRNNFGLWYHSQRKDAGRQPSFYPAPTPELFPQSDVPVRWLSLLVILYLLLALPGNYFLLRRLRRREAGWVTVPVLSVFFCAGISLCCFWIKGSSTQVSRFTVLTQGSPGYYAAMGYVSIFAPHSQEYRVSLPAGSPSRIVQTCEPQVEQSQPTTLREETGAAVNEIPISQWTSRTLAYTFNPGLPGSITGTASYSPETHSWTIRVQNSSSLDLEECRAWTGSGWLKLGALPPGRTISISGIAPPLSPRQLKGYATGGSTGSVYDEPLPEATRGGTYERRLRDREWELFQRLSGLLTPWTEAPHTTRGVFLVGWSRQPLQPASVAGSASSLDETMVITPLEAAVGKDGLEMPPGSLESAYLNSSDLYSNGGQRAAIHLPEKVLAHPEANLHLELNLHPGAAISVWSPGRMAWVRVTQKSSDRFRSIDLSPVGRYVTPLSVERPIVDLQSTLGDIAVEQASISEPPMYQK